MNNEALEQVQEQIDYWFQEPKLLRQAFTRKSYAEEHPGTQDNEVLEFYGDKALEFVVMKKMSAFYGCLSNNGKYVSEKSEGQLTGIKKKLVDKSMLAHRIERLGFYDYLIMGKGDINQNAQNDDSVREDLFEAIVGAVAIDCEWDAEKIEEVVDLMLDIDHYLEEGFDDESNYVDLIQQWCQKKYGYLPTYEFDFNERENGYDCILTFSEDDETYNGFGTSKRDARMDAAANAYRDLDENDELILPIDEIGEPDRERAINQLQELYQKRYIGEPSYQFSERYDDNGNPIWRCECHVDGKDEFWYGDYASKKQGKKSVAFDMLCDILNWENKE